MHSRYIGTILLYAKNGNGNCGLSVKRTKSRTRCGAYRVMESGHPGQHHGRGDQGGDRLPGGFRPPRRPRFMETRPTIPKTKKQKVQHHLLLDLLPTTINGAR